jgi:large subunit ribosomal protein L21
MSTPKTVESNSLILVIETGGKQYLVKPGDKIEIEKLKNVQGQDLIFDRVLLAYDEKNHRLNLGKPYIKNASVKAILLREKKQKTLVLKYKSKTRYRKKKGYKKPLWQVKIKSIEL